MYIVVIVKFYGVYSNFFWCYKVTEDHSEHLDLGSSESIMDPSISETILDPKHGKNEEINLCHEEFTMHIKNEHVD